MVLNLIIMDMPDFDMILGMDFLSIYKVEIDSKKKKVSLVWIMVNSSHSERVNP